jgi:hypothetical protein
VLSTITYAPNQFGIAQSDPMHNQIVFSSTDRLHRIAVAIFYACAAVSIAFTAMVLIGMASA